jgi:hypothetical protein
VAVDGERHAPTALPRDRSPLPIVRGGWLSPRAGSEKRKYFAATGVQTPNIPSRSESLYGLRYPRPVSELRFESLSQPRLSVQVRKFGNLNFSNSV